MKLSERISELQWIFARMILWYRKNPSDRKDFRNELDYWIRKTWVKHYDFDPRNREGVKDASQSKRDSA